MYSTYADINKETKSQTTGTIVMARPNDFCFNEQTGIDNEYQKRPNLRPKHIRSQALKEFEQMVSRLDSRGVEVLVLEKKSTSVKTPDAVFPNNWFTTTADGGLFIYPMLTENRRQERQAEQLSILLNNNGFVVNHTTWIGSPVETNSILEGTGVMIFDHPKSTVYAAISERCSPQQLRNLSRLKDIEKAVLFETSGSGGKPVYHTNVVMSIGEYFAVLCPECFTFEEQLETVTSSLSADREIIEISMAQMENSFCGNILQIKNKSGDPLIVMSESAFNGFSKNQIEKLSRYGELVINPIPTIEEVGGGSCRCMMAEIFLPRNNSSLTLALNANPKYSCKLVR